MVTTQNPRLIFGKGYFWQENEWKLEEESRDFHLKSEYLTIIVKLS